MAQLNIFCRQPFIKFMSHYLLADVDRVLLTLIYWHAALRERLSAKHKL